MTDYGSQSHNCPRCRCTFFHPTRDLCWQCLDAEMHRVGITPAKRVAKHHADLDRNKDLGDSYEPLDIVRRDEEGGS